MVHMDIPQDVAYILEKLRNAGYEAYAVGGCVRDGLLGRPPKDWDITTSALPEEVKAVFTRTIDTGIKHGTVTVMVNGVGVEVTTYRVDGEYLDGRHPKEVTFTPKLEEDLKRRDFTINAFVYNENEGVKDLFNGLDDLKNKIIRCVGDPEERFGEDALRILRAIRFAAVLGFTIEPATYNAAVKLAGNLKKISAERIKTEMDKTLLSDNPDFILKYAEMGIASAILPEMENIENTELLMKALKISKQDLSIRWALLIDYMEDWHKIAKEIFIRLKFDNKTADKISLFLSSAELLSDKYSEKIATLMFSDEYMSSDSGYDRLRRTQCRMLLNIVGEEYIFEYLDYCDAMNLGFYKEKNKIIKDELIDILEKKECYALRMLAVNGRDIMALDLAQGKEVGEMLEHLLMEVIISPEKNDREYLLKEARTYRDGKI